MLKWHETFDGLAAEHIPLDSDDQFHLVINYRKGYECRDGSWSPGYFFVGVLCRKPLYGHLFVHDKDHIESAEDAVRCVWDFTGFPHASIIELKRIIETNGDLPPFNFAGKNPGSHRFDSTKPNKANTPKRWNMYSKG
jgi:hypothetical protein